MAMHEDTNKKIRDIQDDKIIEKSKKKTIGI